VGNQRRSKSLSPSLSASPDRIPSGEAPGSVPRKTASKRLSESRTQIPSPFPFRQLGRPLWEGERQLLTVLAGEYVSSLLLLSTETDKEEPIKTIPPPRITRKGGKNGHL
jgi:hypothetical protein